MKLEVGKFYRTRDGPKAGDLALKEFGYYIRGVCVEQPAPKKKGKK